MRQGILAIAAVGLVAAALASNAAGQSVGAPASQTVVAAGQDWATRTFQKPIDMDQWTDVSWWLYANDGPLTNLSGVTHTTCTGGGSTSTCLKATTAGTGSNLWILETGNPPSSRIGKTGDNFPIDASTYKTVAVRMRLNTGGACNLAVPTLACTAGYLWHKGTLYDTPTTETRSNSFFTFDGWQIYFIDLPTFGYASGSPLAPWTGTIGDLRLNLTATAGAAIEIDWIRLVPNDLPTQTITWSGFSGRVDIYLDDNQTASDGNLGVLTGPSQGMPSRNVSGGALSFQPGALAAGDYYVEICPTGADPSTSIGCRYSSGFYRVNATPTFAFTSPSPEGSADDFATVQLNQAWDMTSTSQVDYAVHVSDLTATTMAAVNEAGTSLGNVNVLQGNSAAAGQAGSGDPYMYFLWFAGDGRGRYKKIDSSRYHILTLEMGVPDKARDINLGSIARIVWLIEGEETRENVSKDLVFNSRAGFNVMSKITTSMRTCEPSVTEWNHCLRIVTDPAGAPSTTGWAGNIENFRLDPHEYPGATTFYVKTLKLAANEKTVSNLYTVRWTYADLLVPGTPALTLYYDTDIDPSSGLTQIVTGVNPAISSSYAWNTTGVPNGTYYIYASVSDGLNTNAAYSRWPIIVDSSTTSALLPRIALNRRRLDFGGNDNGRLVGDPQTVNVAISGTGASSVRWKVTSSSPLVVVSPASGTASGTFDVSIASSTIYPDNLVGDYYVKVEELVAGTTSNSAQYIHVIFTMYSKTGTSAPFGAFDTPVDGTAGMQGSFAVTGWALDDVGIDRVELWRDLAPGEDSAHAYTTDLSHPGFNKVFIASPLFVPDARPDVESLYAGNPAAYRAGWGYLLLSWGLEGQGNGTYMLHAFAFDKEGHATTLGTKTITVDNAHASKPFGSIDTPGYGETKSGTFVNFGWALTPVGSSVNFGWALTPVGSSSCRIDNGHVWVTIDSLPAALVSYGGARSDIAASFPGFLNSTNASGYYYVNTTTLTNGRHQIGWLVYDSCGRGDGIGSRFFNVLNSGARPSADPAATSGARPLSPALSGASREPVTVRHVGGDWQVIEPNTDGIRVIEVGQSDRIEVRLPLAAGPYTGYLDTRGARRRLPLGSSLDERAGIFYWQPAPGFLGRYDLVFVAPGGIGVRLGVVVGPSMRMAIDTPVSGAEVRRPFALAGWAIDLAGEQGSGVDTVHVWAYPAGGAPPIWLGVAEYGDPRPDVGAIYGTTFTKAAYTLVVDRLPPGSYDVVVYAHRAKTGSFDAAQIVRVTVR